MHQLLAMLGACKDCKQYLPLLLLTCPCNYGNYTLATQAPNVLNYGPSYGSIHGVLVLRAGPRGIAISNMWSKCTGQNIVMRTAPVHCGHEAGSHFVEQDLAHHHHHVVTEALAADLWMCSGHRAQYWIYAVDAGVEQWWLAQSMLDCDLSYVVRTRAELRKVVYGGATWLAITHPYPTLPSSSSLSTNSWSFCLQHACGCSIAKHHLVVCHGGCNDFQGVLLVLCPVGCH